jgi:hypothetical protein
MTAMGQKGHRRLGGAESLLIGSNRTLCRSRPFNLARPKWQCCGMPTRQGCSTPSLVQLTLKTEQVLGAGFGSVAPWRHSQGSADGLRRFLSQHALLYARGVGRRNQF